jgi:hypothetical protein
MSITHHRLKAVGAALTALVVSAPATAAARQELNPPENTTGSPPPAIRIIRISDSGGIDWAAAGIGAAGALGLSAVVTGGGLAVVARRRRTPTASDSADRRRDRNGKRPAISDVSRSGNRHPL